MHWHRSIMHVQVFIFDVTQTHSTCGVLRCKGGSARNVKTGAAMSYIAKTPKPPYYAVVFTSINADVDHTEHTKMYQRMVEIAEGYEGYIGIEPARNPDGSGVAVIYWKDLATIQAFARHPEHVVAKKKGREIWYTHYLIRICKVERDYGRPEEPESIPSPAESA
jgi:heme-degrading monooxygenase HmoA